MITPDLLKRLLNNECTEEEKQLLRSYLTEWDQFLSEEDWEQFKQEGEITPGKSEKWFMAVKKGAFGGYRSVRIRQRVAVAAMVLLMAGAGWKIWYGAHREPPVTASLRKPVDTLAEQVNKGTAPMRIFLEDGSTVDLEPNSGIRYAAKFVTGRSRAVYLRGAASFDVASDPVRPFTVYSGELSTTVLGTAFSVNACAQLPYIKVLLHTGKVVVQPSEQVRRKWGRDIYLLPGQELTYDKSSMIATVRNLNRVRPPVRPGERSPARMPDWYMFNNQSLAQVFDQLSEIYDVNIRYAAGDVTGLYFIGKFGKTDSLDKILQDIALLNGLTVRKEGSQYIVTKKIH